MKKTLLIGLKDLKLAFRDRAALILMLLAPFLLTLGLGVVSGRFSGASSGISAVPVILVNQDQKQLGNALEELFLSSDLEGIVDPQVYNNQAVAYKLVDENRSAAVVLIPSAFTDSIIPPQGGTASSNEVKIQLYSNPTTPTSVGIIKTILEEFLGQVEAGRVSAEVTVAGLIATGRIQPDQAGMIGLSAGLGEAGRYSEVSSITLKNVTPSGEVVKFDILALLSPSMALMFLMYTVSFGGRTFLTEKSGGTLPRLLITPTTPAQVMGGKMIGIFFSGTAQMLILIVGTTLIFSLQWGEPLAVLVLILSAVFAATGWGLLLSAVARTAGQVGAIGTALTLTFGILGGGFVNTASMPAWFRIVMKVSPNAWGLDGFSTLAYGGTLQDILTPILGLLCMGFVLFLAAVILMRRRGLLENR